MPVNASFHTASMCQWTQFLCVFCAQIELKKAKILFSCKICLQRERVGEYKEKNEIRTKLPVFVNAVFVLPKNRNLVFVITQYHADHNIISMYCKDFRINDFVIFKERWQFPKV